MTVDVAVSLGETLGTVTKPKDEAEMKGDIYEGTSCGGFYETAMPRSDDYMGPGARQMGVVHVRTVAKYLLLVRSPLAR